MPDPRAFRRAIPPSLRYRLYDLSPSRRLRWRRVPGLRRASNRGAAVLTFDDGPDARWTPLILDALACLDAKATFFVLGEHILEQQQLVRSARDQGHEIALHGMSHRRHDLLPEAEARAELERGAEAIEGAVGVRPRWYRPPFGRSSEQLAAICAELDLGLAYWTAWGYDWEETPTHRVASAVTRDLSPGAIVLLHDSARYGQRDDAQATLDALPVIVARARALGLTPLDLSSATR